MKRFEPSVAELAFLEQLELPPKARDLAELADRLEALSAGLAQELRGAE